MNRALYVLFFVQGILPALIVSFLTGCGPLPTPIFNPTVTVTAPEATPSTETVLPEEVAPKPHRCEITLTLDPLLEGSLMIRDRARGTILARYPASGYFMGDGQSRSLTWDPVDYFPSLTVTFSIETVKTFDLSAPSTAHMEWAIFQDGMKINYEEGDLHTDVGGNGSGGGGSQDHPCQ